MEGLSDALRNEVRRFGVDVIIIEPGGIKTEWGEIAMQNLLKSTPPASTYRAMADKIAGSFQGTVDHNTDPSVIGRLIVRAVSAAHPRARYTAGFMSQVVFLRRFISDGLFDRLMMSQLR